jgi:DNA-binding CsgD family transcriptional regulator
MIDRHRGSTIPSGGERRGKPRRITDRALDDLYTTFSTRHCHLCMERMAEAVLLLDLAGRVVYATPNVGPILQKLNVAYAPTQELILPDLTANARLSDFIHDQHGAAGTLCLLMDAQSKQEWSLLVCFRLPKPETANSNAASFLVKLRDPGMFPNGQWQLFTQQFHLTSAEARLCKSLAGGLSLTAYSEHWHVSIATARSQLSAVLAKTSTKRQIDLMRLIYLFARI